MGTRRDIAPYQTDSDLPDRYEAVVSFAVSPAKLATARKLYDSKEHTVAEIAEIVGVSRSTLYRALEATPAAEVEA